MAKINTLALIKILALLFFIWGILLLVISVIPSNDMISAANDNERFRLDYLEHFVAFFIFSILFCSWRIKVRKTLIRKEITIFLIAGLLFSGLAEFIQIIIPTRAFNPVDLICNASGLISGIGIVLLIVKSRHTLKSKL